MIFIASLEVEPLIGSQMDGHGVGLLSTVLFPLNPRLLLKES